MAEPRPMNPFSVDRLNSVTDFVSAWDVPSLNADVSEWLIRQIRELHASTTTNPARKIAVLLGPSGYGKTHLFGRVAQSVTNQALFVFTPPLFRQNLDQPLDHIRWNLVESLFSQQGSKSNWMTRLLIGLSANSFRTFMNDLPEQVQNRHRPFLTLLQDDSRAIKQILTEVRSVEPYVRFADSMASLFPGLRSDVVRALALGWSPVAHEARRWLRGDQLTSEEFYTEFRLSTTPPNAEDVIRAAAELFQKVRVPIVLCCDQTEAILTAPDPAPNRFSTDLMHLLQSIPNLQIILSCLKGRWNEVFAKMVDSFQRRLHTFDLRSLNADQAVQLVAGRLEHSKIRDRTREQCWPISEESIRALVTKEGGHVPASTLIKYCAQAIDLWLQSDRSQPVTIPVGQGITEEEAFRQEWDAILAAIRKEPCSADDMQEAALFEPIREIVTLARVGAREKLGDLLPADTSIRHVQDKALPKTSGSYPASLSLSIVRAGKVFDVVVAVSKLNSGYAFTSHTQALRDAIGGNVVGAVLVRPSAELRIKPKALGRKLYDELIEKGKLRPVPLDETENHFDQLRCLSDVIRKAQSGDLIIGGKAIAVQRCRELILKLKLLEGLKLIDHIFNWGVPTPSSPPSLTPARVVSESVAAPPPPKAVERVLQPAVTSVASTSSANVGVVTDSSAVATAPSEAVPERYLRITVERLRAYGQSVVADGIEMGPTFFRLKVRLQGTAEVGKIRSKAESLKTHLGIETRPLIEGQAGFVSIDVQRPDRQFTPLNDCFPGRPEKWIGQPAFCVGTDVGGRTHWLNLAEPGDCHVLVAGITGSGKSEFLKAMLAALAAELDPQRLQFVLIDPKQVTFNFPGESPYFQAPIAHDIDEALPLIENCVVEMQRRYAMLREYGLEHVGQLPESEAVPRIVLVFDEFADLMTDRSTKTDLEQHLKRLGGMARAAGIHLVLGTQRPEATVVTPLLRSNLPGRISLRVASERDSKLILEDPNAAYLLDRGDLFWKRGGGMLRLQSPYVNREALHEFLRII